MKYRPDQSIERKANYKLSLQRLGTEEIAQMMVDVYLGQEFGTEFEAWMAQQDVDEFKRRFFRRLVAASTSGSL